MALGKKEHRITGREAADYYRLKTKAVDDLVHADVSNSPKVSEEELRKYRSHGGFSVPETAKILFIKFWFPAAVCFFFLWGLGTYVSAMLDLLFITGLALGIVTDLLTNNVLRFFAETEGANDRWMMFPKKRYITFFQNIFYAFVVLFLVYTIYNAINAVLIAAMGLTDTIPLGVEPILFGLFYLLCDTALIELKRLCVRIFEDAKSGAAGERSRSDGTGAK